MTPSGVDVVFLIMDGLSSSDRIWDEILNIFTNLTQSWKFLEAADVHDIPSGLPWPAGCFPLIIMELNAVNSTRSFPLWTFSITSIFPWSNIRRHGMTFHCTDISCKFHLQNSPTFQTEFGGCACVFKRSWLFTSPWSSQQNILSALWIWILGLDTQHKGHCLEALR